MGAAWAGAAAAMAGAAVSIGGSLLLNQMVPPPSAEVSQDYGNDKPAWAISGGRNRANPWGKVPFLLGRFQLTPPYAAIPYREIVGGDIYWRALFALSHGPVVIEEMRIGETLLDAFEGVETEFRRGYWSLTDRGAWDPQTAAYPSSPAFADTWTAQPSRQRRRGRLRGRRDDHLQRAGLGRHGRWLGPRPGPAVQALPVRRLRGRPGGRGRDQRDPHDPDQRRRDQRRVHLCARAVPHPERSARQTLRPHGADPHSAVTDRRRRPGPRSRPRPSPAASSPRCSSATAGSRPTTAPPIRAGSTTSRSPTSRASTTRSATSAISPGSRSGPSPRKARCRSAASPCSPFASCRRASSRACSTSCASSPRPSRATTTRSRARGSGGRPRNPRRCAATSCSIRRASARRPTPPSTSPALADWDAITRAKGRVYNGVVEAKGSLWSALVDIARVGRATPSLRDLIF